MKSILAFASILVVSSMAWAAEPFTGTWHGSGTMTAFGGSLQCNDVQIDIQQAVDSLSVQRKPVNCVQADGTGTTLSWAPMTYKIDGSNVLLNGKVVGQISDSEIDLYRSADGGQWNWTYRIEAGALQIHEVNLGPTTFEATLTR